MMRKLKCVAVKRKQVRILKGEGGGGGRLSILNKTCKPVQVWNNYGSQRGDPGWWEP